MNLIELLFLIVCIWILYVAIDYAWQDIRDAEKELEELKRKENKWMYYHYLMGAQEAD